MSTLNRAKERKESQKARHLRKFRQRILRERRRQEGQPSRSHTTRPNRTSPYQDVTEEQQARSEALLEHARLIRRELPVLLKGLSKIPDPRNPKLITHKITCLFVYGILMFVLQTGSRRKSNEILSAPAVAKTLQQLFPDLETIPHHDALQRLLARIDVQGIEQAQLKLARELIREKKFQDYRVSGRYLIAIDGTQKLVRDELISDQWLCREVGDQKNKRLQYYLMVLEANLVLSSGVSIPLISEFVDYTQGDTAADKQDCEQRAFMRLTDRLKSAFPHLPITVLLDGLYPTGPVMKRCKKFKWQFMITLKEGNLPYVWQEWEGIRKLQGQECRYSQQYKGRTQTFQWVNDIDYRFGKDKRERITVHAVVCDESWQEIDETGELVTRQVRFAWVSDQPFCCKTVHSRCNLGARNRWGIEESFQVEKHHGYNYEHLYAENWNAMRGYHYLMRIGHLLNVLAELSVNLAAFFHERGTQGFIEFVRTTLQGLWLQGEDLQGKVARPYQLRLLYRMPEVPVEIG